MLTVQACQHRLVVVHLNKAKSFPAAAKLELRRENRGTRSEYKCSKGTRIRSAAPNTSEEQSKNVGRKHKELSERRRAFGRENRRGKRVARKAARMKQMAARARSQLDELMLGTFNVRKAAVNGVDGIGHIEPLL